MTAKIIRPDFRKPRSVYVIEGDADQVAKTICEGIQRKPPPDDDTPPQAA